MKRRRWKIAVCLLALLAGSATWLYWLKPLQDHRRWYDRVRGDILALADKRPPELDQAEWEFVVCWTLQLHANCGWPDRVDRHAINPFAAELERRLAEPVGLATINWIWDEYCQFSRSGQAYSDKFRPTHPENWRHAVSGGGCGIVVP